MLRGQRSACEETGCRLAAGKSGFSSLKSLQAERWPLFCEVRCMVIARQQ